MQPFSSSLLTFVFAAMLAFFCVAPSSVIAQDSNVSSTAANSELALVPLIFSNGVEIEVEFANDPNSRALGLMFRKEMCTDCGMLFKFDRVRIASIWMKNTYIPLDLAYINAFGTIVDIKALQPHDLTSVKSSVPVLYALEMNQGWFANNSLAVGDTVKLPSYIK
ncbi:DUF192 domain-containing protein [Glaciecola siphonariae]|uniref:DUF192 domain-containing protein n=1 Tax=Glaciecola siphonariae TaxID=521012 RepID=A0ABV9LYG9_9ALTE